MGRSHSCLPSGGSLSRGWKGSLCLGQVLCGVRIGGVSQNKAAEKEFRIAIELDPTNARAYYYLGHLKLYGSNQRDAAADLRTAVKLDPNLGAAYAYLSHFSNDAVGKKIAYARKAVEFDPSDSYAHTALSIALRGSGHLDESLSAARAAVACDPNDAFAHCMLGEGGFVRRWYQRASCGGM